MKHKHSDIEELIREGKKIQAIKLWREKTGVSLKEAKMQIEQLERDGTSTPLAATAASETSSTIESPDEIDEGPHNLGPVARQNFGFGYWLVVLILLGFLANQFLS